MVIEAYVIASPSGMANTGLPADDDDASQMRRGEDDQMSAALQRGSGVGSRAEMGTRLSLRSEPLYP